MTEPESHTLAYLRRIDEKLDGVQDRLGTVEGRLDRVEGRLGRIEDELLVLNGIALRLEGREIETRALKAILDRHERWLGDLGRRVTELDGVKKEWPAQLLGGRLGLRGDLVGGALSNPSDHAESMA